MLPPVARAPHAPSSGARLFYIAASDSRTWTKLFTLAVVGLAAALRFHNLGHTSLWLDEVGQVVTARLPLPGLLEQVKLHHGAAPLDYLITALAVRLGQSEAWLRLPSAIWGTLSVLYLICLGRRIYSPAAGLAAGLLLAVSPFHIRYSQEVRFYSLFVLLSLAGTVALLAAWEKPAARRWLVYAGVMALALYTHYYAALVLIAHGAWVLASWLGSAPRAGKRFAAFLIAVGASAVAFMPWVIWAVMQETGSRSFTPPRFSLDLLRAVLVELGGRSVEWWWAGALMAAVGLVILALRSAPHALLVGLWTIAALPAVVLVDQRVGYLFHSRQLLHVVPIYLLCIGIAAARAGELAARLFKDRNPKAGARVTVAAPLIVALVLTAVTLPATRSYYAESRDDWRAAGRLLEANLLPGERALALNARYYLDFYSPSAAQVAEEAQSLDEVQRAYDSGQPLWIVVSPYLDQLAEGAAMRSWLAEQPAFDLDLGMSMHVIYLQKGAGKPELWKRASTLQIPELFSAWYAFGKAARATGQPGAGEIAGAAMGRAAELAQDSAERARSAFEAAGAAMVAGRLAEALPLYDQVVAGNPANLEARVQRAATLLRLDEPQRAWQDLRIVLARAPSPGYWAYRLAGEALGALGEHEEALDNTLQALALKPEAHELRYRIALLHGELGQPAEAHNWLEDYLRSDPQGPLAPDARRRLGLEPTSG